MASYLLVFQKAYSWLDRNPRYARLLEIIILVTAIALGLYVRIVPVFYYGLELQGNDPWIEYWTANYTYTHGVISWWSLTQDNPVVKKFWYPWGRDFVHSTYPGIAVFAALTYPIAQAFGLSLKDWIALQPLVYAVLTTVFVYLAVKELLDGNKLAGLAAALLYAVLPAAADRTMVGFVEKEGAGTAFIFLFVYLYSKMVKIDHKVNPRKKLLYALLAGLAMAMVGWYWGGYQYLFAAFAVFVVVYPIIAREKITLQFIAYNLVISLSSLLFVSIAPTNIKSLGIYPFRFSLGVFAIALYILPIIYYFGAKKKLLTPLRYTLLLGALVIGGIYLATLGYLGIGGRIAYALGLRFLVKDPLVYSIEEHQPVFEVNDLVTVLNTWAYTAFFFSIFGALYLLYRGRADQLLSATLFLIAFYAYMNATYFEAVAASFGILTTSAFLAILINRIVPSRKKIVYKRRSYVTFKDREGGGLSKAIALLLVIAVIVTAGIAYADTVRMHSRMIPSILSAGTGLGVNRAWYKTLDFIRENTSSNALIVTWWDYGYWISVIADRATLADGATLNGTQIMYLAKFLTAINESEAISILKKFRPPINETYVIVYDAFWFIHKPGTNTYFVKPFDQGPLAGRVDIPKSIWMIRIGRRNIADYLYLYVAKDLAIVGPRFDEPEKLPIIYKIMVDGILYLNEINKTTNVTYNFLWFTGSEMPLEQQFAFLQDRLGITTEIQITSQYLLFPNDRNKTAMVHLKPYKIIVEPFDPPITGRSGEGLVWELKVVVFIYKVSF